MARLRIDAEDIDVEELERQVEAAIRERLRRGRFREHELEALRAAVLHLRPRTDAIPRFSSHVAAARARFPGPGPGPETRPPTEVRRPGPAEPGKIEPAPEGLSVFRSGAARTLRGRLLSWCRRLLHPLARAVLDVDALERGHAGLLQELRQRDDMARTARERDFDRLLEYVDRRVDALHDAVQERIDRGHDWMGGHVSDLDGRLDRRHERDLHLLFNLVAELTTARVDLTQAHERMSELERRLQDQATRVELVRRSSEASDAEGGE